MRRHGNDNIGAHEEKQLEVMQEGVEVAMRSLLDALGIDWKDDPNMADTPRRVAKLYTREVFSGRFTARPEMTSFPADGADQVYTVGPIDVRSCCSHHLCPVIGKAYIAVLPGERLLGLSKFSRLARWVFQRPQIQEGATKQLADELCDILQPRGLAVVVQATHTCMTWRGVQESDSTMVTSDLRGMFRDDARARSEVFDLLRAQGLR